MKKLLVLMCVISLLGLVGCASLNKSQPSGPLYTEVKAELKADVEVGGDIKGTSNMVIILGIFKIGDSKFADGVQYVPGGAQEDIKPFSFGPTPFDLVKSAAAYKAVKESGADVIITPAYEVEVNDYFVFKQINGTVTGKKGKIKSIK